MVQTYSKTVTIVNQKGMHARASARFVKLASTFDAAITVSRGDQAVDGCSIMGLLTLAASKGRKVLLTAEGPMAKKAVIELSALIQNGFDEEDDD